MKHLIKNRTSGLIYVAVGIGAADTLEQSQEWQKRDYKKDYDKFGPQWKAEVDECWARNKYDGYWIPNIGRVVTTEKEKTSEWEHMGSPFDKQGREIKVGDVIVYAMRDLTVSEMKITKIEKKNFDTVMHGVDLHTNKKTKNSYPRRCLKVSP